MENEVSLYIFHYPFSVSRSIKILFHKLNFVVE